LKNKILNKHTLKLTILCLLGCLSTAQMHGAFLSKISPYINKFTDRLSSMLDETALAVENPLEVIRLNRVANIQKQNAEIAQEPSHKKYFQAAISKSLCKGKLNAKGEDLPQDKLHLFDLPSELQDKILQEADAANYVPRHLAGAFQQYLHEAQSLTILPGNLLASSSYRTIKIWNYKTGTYQRTLGGGLNGSHWIFALAALPNNKVASGAYDKTIKIWDTKTGACLKTLHGHEEWIQSLANLTEDRLASGSWDGAIKIWNTATGGCIRTLQHSTILPISSLAFLGNNLLASASWLNIKIWNISTGECLRTLDGHTKKITSLAYLSNNKLASGSEDGTIKIWNTTSGSCIKTFISNVTALAALSDGTLVSGSDLGIIKFWNHRTGQYLQILRGHEKAITSIAACPSKNGRLFSSSDKNINMWRSRIALGRSCEPSLHKPFYTKEPSGYLEVATAGVLTGISICTLLDLVTKSKLRTVSPREIFLSTGISLSAGIAGYKLFRKARSML
jgi:WD40 repeat protein